ncbi:MAG TPA: hypothetical protein VNO24_07420 [Blastocatellia bacterium]|nr:hypothetical protein [Blastocatellia bacterium]
MQSSAGYIPNIVAFVVEHPEVCNHWDEAINPESEIRELVLSQNPPCGEKSG